MYEKVSNINTKTSIFVYNQKQKNFIITNNVKFSYLDMITTVKNKAVK